MLVGRVIVGDQVQLEIGADMAVEVVEKGEELLVPMARFALGDDRPVEDVERREQCRGAVPIVVVGYLSLLKTPKASKSLAIFLVQP